MPLLYLILLSLSPSLSAIKLELQNLHEDYPEAVCNDGSPAVYYKQGATTATLDKMLVFLEGGGACASKEECLERCGSEDTWYLCTSSWAVEEIWRNGTIWGEDQLDNPPFFDYFKVDCF